MLAISIVNLILSIFGITVSSIFILFWCGRYFCARFFMRRVSGSHGLFLLGTAHTRRMAEHNSVGVNPLVIAYFPTITFRQDTFLPRLDAMCAVCLGDYKDGELLRMLPQCGHNFHVSCIDAWLRQHATCPVCRMSLQGYFVGRTTAALQPTPSTSDQPEGPGPFTAHSDVASLGSLPSGQTSQSGVTPGLESSMVLSVSNSQSDREGCHDSVRGPRAQVDGHGVELCLTHSVERG